MKTRFSPTFNRLAVLFGFLVALSACAPKSTPTLFIPPTEAAPLLIPATQISSTSIPTIIPTIVVPTPTPPCTDSLTFVQDLTIPDGTTVAPGASIDKQWLVTNSGTCNWDARYRLKLISGDAMGAASEQALYPARAGAQATLELLFSAPQEAGTYQSGWQAVGRDGATFGDSITIEIVVQ